MQEQGFTYIWSILAAAWLCHCFPYSWFWMDFNVNRAFYIRKKLFSGDRILFKDLLTHPADFNAMKQKCEIVVYLFLYTYTCTWCNIMYYLM